MQMAGMEGSDDSVAEKMLCSSSDMSEEDTKHDEQLQLPKEAKGLSKLNENSARKAEKASSKRADDRSESQTQPQASQGSRRADGPSQTSNSIENYRIPKIKKRKRDDSDPVGDELEDLLNDDVVPDSEEEDGEILSDIEQEFEREEGTGPKITDRLEKFMTTLLKNPLSEEKMKAKMENHKCPQNCVMTIPKVNAEIWAKMDRKTRMVDISLRKVQQAISKATVAAVKTCDALKAAKPRGLKEMMTDLTDTISMNLKTMQDLSMERRKNAVSSSFLYKKWKRLASSEVPVGKYLWEDLKLALKRCEGTSKLGVGYIRSSRGNKYFPQSSHYHSYGAKNQNWYQRNASATRPQKQQKGRGRGRGWNQNAY